MTPEKYICPVCGFQGLNEPASDSFNNPSHEICPCCGFEFGFEDTGFAEYRRRWIETGSRWFIPDRKPKGWKLAPQLKNIKPNRGAP